MQQKVFFIILGAGALALPTTDVPKNTASSSGAQSNAKTSAFLTKRGRFGWVSTYGPGDSTCSHGYLAGFRPKVHMNCITFEDPQGINDYIGINWGDAPLGFTGLQGYSDQHCKNAVGHSISSDNVNNTNWRGANTCVSIADYDGPWGSVQGLGVYLADSG